MNSPTEEVVSKELIDNIFKKYENLVVDEYIPEAQTIEDYPEYTPTPKTAGPRPITIAEYRQRQNKPVVASPRKQHKPRGGKKVKLRQKAAEVHRILAITTDNTLRKSLKSILVGIKAEQKTKTPKRH